MSPLIDCCVDYTESAETVLLDDGMDPIQITVIASMWPYTIVQWSGADRRASIAGGLVADAIRKPCSLRESGEGPMKTAAAVAHSLRTPFVVEDVELPDLQDTDVLVRIVAAGVCHTDLASRDGQLPAPCPAIVGHEGAGVAIKPIVELAAPRLGEMK
jgi:hypothetical protein